MLLLLINIIKKIIINGTKLCFVTKILFRECLVLVSVSPSSTIPLTPSPSVSASKLIFFGDDIQLDTNSCSSLDVVADIRITENPISNVNSSTSTNA